MVYQSNSNGIVSFKKQSGQGTAGTTGAGATQLRLLGGAGIKLAKAAVASSEVRQDGMSTRGRHGTQKISAAYSSELALGSHDPLIEAVMRSAFDSTSFVKTQTDFTSLTVGANTLTLGSGNPITMGFRIGDVIRPTNLADAGNNSRNLRIIGLSSTVITVAETLIVNATPDTSCTLTRPGKRLINPATLLKAYYTLDEYEIDTDLSTVVQDFVWSSLKFSMKSDGLIQLDSSGMGTGQVTAEASGASPYFTSPTLNTGSPFSVVDATVRVNGVDLVELSSFDISLDIGASAPAVFGSGSQKFSPDVFTGPLQVAVNMTMLRKDLAKFSDFIAETQYSLQILAVNNMSEPKDFFSIFVPNFTLGGVDPSAFSKSGGGRTQTVSIPAGLVGEAVDATLATDPTMISFQTTAP